MVGQRFAGAAAEGEVVVERLGVGRRAHAQDRAAGRRAVRPRVRGRAELEVGDPDDAERGRPALHLDVRRDGGAGLAEGVGDPRVRREPLGLLHHRVATRQVERVEGDRVEPGVVAVAGDEGDRPVRGDRVEGGDRRLLGPAGGAVAPRDDRTVGGGEPLGHRAESGVVVLDPDEVEAGQGERPLPEVDVLVPEAGHQPAPVGVLAVTLEPLPDLGDDPVVDADVDRPVGRRMAAEVDQAHAPEDEPAHEAAS